MKMIFSQFTLQEAINANKQNSLEQWTQEYLRSVGRNSQLADHLINHGPLTVELVQFSLQKLTRIMGPEEGMLFFETAQKWEKRVKDLMIKIEKGESLAPLIVTDFWEPNQISDGSHRHEAFLRLGIKEYWVSFFKKKSDSKV